MSNDILATPGFAVAVFGPDLLLKKANLAFTKLFLYPGIPYGISAVELVTKRDRDIFQAQLNGVFLNQPFTFRSFGFMCADGSSFFQPCNAIWNNSEYEKIELALLWKMPSISTEVKLDHFQSSILNQIKDGVFVLEKSGKIIYWNRGAESLFNSPVSFALGKKHDFLPHTQILADAFKQIQEDASVRLSGELEIGVKHWISYEISGWFSDSGIFEGVICISKDVSIRKNLEAEIRDSESFYRAMYEDSPLPMFIYDVESLRILEANLSACVFYEYKREQLQRLSIYDLRPEEEKQRFAERLESIRDSQKTRQLQTGTWIHETRTGKLIHVEVLSHAVDFHGHNARLVVVRDVSRERLQSKRLQESENRLKLIFDQSEDMILTFDRNLRVVLFNKTLQDALFKSEGARIQAGMTVSEFMRPHDADFWQKRLERALIGEHLHLEHKHLGVSGEALFVQATAQPIYDEAKISGVALFIKDLSESRRREFLLQASSRMAQIGAWEYNILNKKLYWTEIVYDIHEMLPSEELSVDRAISFYTPSDRPIIKAAFENLIQTGQSFDLILQLVTQKGKTLWVRSIGELEKDGNTPILVKGTFQDVTKDVSRQQELKEISERMETASKAAKIGVWEFRIGETFARWNKSNFALHGIPETTDLTIPLNWIDVFPEEVRASITSAYSKSITQKTSLDVEFTVAVNGESRHFRSYGKPYFSQNGEVERLIGITQDITDSVIARESLKISLVEKETLLSEIHHRVKNNFSVITSLLGLHIAGSSDPVLKSILSESRKRIMSMALVHEKLYQNKSFSNIDFSNYLVELIQLIKAGFEKQPDTVSFNIAADGVYLDIVQAVPFGLLINELVSNSLKHAFEPHQDSTISIEMEQNDEELRFYYRDNGRGFDFNSTSLSNKTLGIVLIKLLIRQLQGEIILHEGSGFALEMKIRRSQAYPD